MIKGKIGIIGGGNMGEALIKRLLNTYSVNVYEINSEREKYIKQEYKISCEQSVNSLVSKVDIIILAIKPNEMESVLTHIKFLKPKQLFISIAAGLTIRFFEKNLGNKPRVVRAMPNLPALIGAGMTGICAGQYIKRGDLKLAQSILESIGQTLIVNESMMDAVTAISGSGPAYLFLFVEQWINAAVKLGFNRAQAKQLVYKTLLGSAHLLEKSEFDAAQLRVKVTSKGGTTQAAMDVFSQSKFNQLIYKALLAAKKRAKELAK